MRRRNNGEGSYLINKKKKQYEYYERYIDNEGITKRKHLRASSKEELDKKVEEWKRQLAEGMLQEDKRITVAEWSDRYLQIVKTTVKTKTFKHYKAMIDNYIKPVLGQIRLERLTTERVQLWLNGLVEKNVLSPATVASFRRCLITMLNVAMKYRILTYNAAFYSKPPRMARKQPPVLTLDQIRNLLAIAAKDDFLDVGLVEPHRREEFDVFLHRVYFIALFLSIFLGTRRGETFGLCWSDYDPENRLLRIRYSLSNHNGVRTLEETKTAHSDRTILLPKTVCILLDRWRMEQDAYARTWSGYYKNDLGLILPNSRGNIISYTNHQKRWWNPLKKAAKLPEGFRWHNLRATNATLMAAENIDIKTVSERLGHSSPEVTEKYYLGQTGRQIQAADVLEKIINNVTIAEAEIVNVLDAENDKNE